MRIKQGFSWAPPQRNNWKTNIIFLCKWFINFKCFIYLRMFAAAGRSCYHYWTRDTQLCRSSHFSKDRLTRRSCKSSSLLLVKDSVLIHLQVWLSVFLFSSRSKTEKTAIFAVVYISSGPLSDFLCVKNESLFTRQSIRVYHRALCLVPAFSVLACFSQKTLGNTAHI